MKAFGAWLGPRKERHDFRFEKNDLEVKATRRPTRIHVVHGLSQFDPSDDHGLFVLSLQFERAGNAPGRSLSDRVASVRGFLPAGTTQKNSFEEHLKRLGYRDGDASYYGEKMKFFRPPLLVEVDGNCPAITATLLSGQLSKKLLGRIDRVQYEVNLEGLGVEEGHVEFKKVLSGLGPLE